MVSPKALLVSQSSLSKWIFFWTPGAVCVSVLQSRLNRILVWLVHNPLQSYILKEMDFVSLIPHPSNPWERLLLKMSH